MQWLRWGMLFVVVGIGIGCGDFGKMVVPTTDEEIPSEEQEIAIKPIASLASIPRLQWPTDRGVQVGLGFGDDWVDKGCDGKWKAHTGIDIQVGKGRPVYAAEKGRVTWVGYNTRWKGWITISHTDGRGQGYTTVYWHVAPLVKLGWTVSRGQKIATVADMAGAHLHFGVRNTPYANTANRGALPRTQSCGPDDPRFPEKFESPLNYTSS